MNVELDTEGIKIKNDKVLFEIVRRFIKNNCIIYLV
jgi:hypothetical protein